LSCSPIYPFSILLILLALYGGGLRYSDADGSFTIIGGFDIFSVLMDSKEISEDILRERASRVGRKRGNIPVVQDEPPVLLALELLFSCQ